VKCSRAEACKPEQELIGQRYSICRSAQRENIFLFDRF
jgi:hypothetical protein